MSTSPIPLPFHRPAGGPPPLASPVRGPHFTYLLPAGWTIGEEGPFALVLRSADLAAGIIVFGQSGLMSALAPDQFAHQAMAGVMRLAPDVRLFDVRPVPPMPGYTHAAAMETTYTISGPAGMVPLRGVVVSNVSVGYGQCNGVITIAASDVTRWENFHGWLPQLALAAHNTGPDAYGSRTMAGMIAGIAQQENAANSQYRAWSESLWQGVAADRAASQDRQRGALGPMLTGQEWRADPYGNQPQQWSTTPAVIWVSRDGRQVTSADPSFDPRTPMDGDWRRVR